LVTCVEALQYFRPGMIGLCCANSAPGLIAANAVPGGVQISDGHHGEAIAAVGHPSS
jgi:hypothetical protein